MSLLLGFITGQAQEELQTHCPVDSQFDGPWNPLSPVSTWVWKDISRKEKLSMNLLLLQSRSHFLVGGTTKPVKGQRETQAASSPAYASCWGACLPHHTCLCHSYAEMSIQDLQHQRGIMEALSFTGPNSSRFSAFPAYGKPWLDCQGPFV